ncbi:TPA: multidrug DMT transporter permease [Escherichia coli]|nr:multidrug DMT transporter permease [Escherichia coli]
MSLTDSDGQGSFRGVPFLVYQEQRERGGRNVVKREYPLRESGGADDLGPKLPEYTFTAVVTGDDVHEQRSRLRNALRAPGAGELMHPDYGTMKVLINSFESRYNVSEQGVVEFTISVIPVSDDTAPAVTQDTSASLTAQSSSALDSVFSTLANGWTVISEGLHDMSAMAGTVSEKVEALENAISGMGIVQDVSAFAATFTALKGNITALLTTPVRMASSLAGLISALIALPELPSLSTGGTPTGSLTTSSGSTDTVVMSQLYSTLSSLRYNLSTQDEQRVLTGLTTAAQNNIRLLQVVMQSAATLAQVQVAGDLLGTAVSQHAQNSDDNADTRIPFLESAPDVSRISSELATSLDTQALTLSSQGYTGAALSLRSARLALTDDFISRGVRLPGAVQVQVRTTEPALVTLYRATGDSTRWQRFVRRNGIVDPLFVPGGSDVEVISDQ